MLSQTINSPGDVQFKLIKIEEGLSQSSVPCIIQDKKGYLWFGTANGLNKYDGYTFNVFVNDPSDSTSISDNGILSLFEDKVGNIWIGTSQGVLNKYDRRKAAFTHYNIIDGIKTEADPDEKYYDFPLPYSRNSENSITAIAVDDKGIVWIGTWGKGLVKFNPVENKIQHYHYNENEPEGFHSNRVKSIIADNNGVVWVATLGGGLYKIISDGNKDQIYHYRKSTNPNSLNDDRLVSLSLDSEGNLWIGTYNKGLYMLSKKNQQLNPAKAKFEKFFFQPLNIITSIIQSIDKSIWFATLGSGVFKLDPQRKNISSFKNDPLNPNSIVKNEVLSVFEDRSGSIWIGSNLGKGINKLEVSTVKFKQINKDLKKLNGLNDDVVWAIYQDIDLNIWVGTYKGGLNKIDAKRKKYSYYKINQELREGLNVDNHIRAIFDDSNGNLWLGTYNGGIKKFNKASAAITSFLHDSNDSTSIGANQVQAIFMDSSKNLWVGTFGGGLNKILASDFASGIIRFHNFKNNVLNPFSISDNRIYSIFQDRKGTLWVGTFGGGLNKFDDKTERFISYKKIKGDESSLNDNRVMTIFEDSMNNLWIGTYGGGIQKFNRQTEKFSQLTGRNRINSSVVYGILEDDNKNLWLSSDNGLIKYNLQTEYITLYDLHDGLQSMEFSGGAYFKSLEGEMFFGGVNGFNYFHPDSIIDNQYIPPVVISSIKIFNEPVRKETDSLELSYSQNFFSFEFAALDYTNPADNQYAYKLEGFDDDWHYVGAQQRIVNYSNLLPGEYVFIVKGSNNDGMWNNVGTKIYLKILPPFWRTWWFLTAAVILVAFIIYYLSTMRYRNLLAIEKLKGKLAADLHDNVGSGLTEISILSELATHQLKSASSEDSKHLSKISEKARHLVDIMSDIVWMVNPKRDSFYHLMLRLKDTYSDLLNMSEISFKTSNLEKLRSMKIPMEYKQNLFLIFKEGINNAIKHSKCKKISLEANLIKEKLELVLKDDGIGIDKEIKSRGDGINNMINRAKFIEGNLEIDSSNEGTIIKFSGKVAGIKNTITSYFK